MNLIWYDVKPEDEKYGLLVGEMLSRLGETVPFKQWSVSLYDTERGRKMAIKQALRNNPNSDTMIFTIRGKEFFDKAVAVFDRLPERGRAKGTAYEQDVSEFIRSKRTSN